MGWDEYHRVAEAMAETKTTYIGSATLMENIDAIAVPEAIQGVLQATPDAAARNRLIAAFDIDVTVPNWALGYRFDFVLRGRGQTPFEPPGDPA